MTYTDYYVFIYVKRNIGHGSVMNKNGFSFR
jgi:hypothetical protein